jgi:hypothetical protein
MQVQAASDLSVLRPTTTTVIGFQHLQPTTLRSAWCRKWGEIGVPSWRGSVLAQVPEAVEGDY